MLISRDGILNEIVVDFFKSKHNFPSLRKVNLEFPHKLLNDLRLRILGY